MNKSSFHFIKRFTQIDCTQSNCIVFPALMKRSTTCMADSVYSNIQWNDVYMATSLQPIPFQSRIVYYHFMVNKDSHYR